MSLESLGGRMPPGRPAAVFAGGKTHVFAIAAGGAMNHWSAPNGLDWTGPAALPAGPTNLEPSYPCAVAFQNGVHVFAINHGDGSLVHFFSSDGASFMPPIWAGAGIPGGANGVAASTASAATAGLIDTFAATPGGIVQNRWRLTGSLASTGTLPASGGLPRGVPAAVSSGANVTDVFAFDQNGDVVRWHSSDGVNWTKAVLPRRVGPAAGPLVRSGFAAVSPTPGQVELFAVTSDGMLTNWSFGPASSGVKQLSAAGLDESVPAAAVTDDGHIELFAILRNGNLIRWRWRAGTWTDTAVFDANLASGGVGAAASQRWVDAFGFNSGANNSLLHWPAGIAGANTNEPWANWANNQSLRPKGHLHPQTPEEVVAIVKTAERDPNARVRAVGSSWSFPDIAMTPSYLVETNALRGLRKDVIDPDRPRSESVLTANSPEPKYLLHVEAGIQVEALMAVLDLRKLAPFTMGGASGQTLGGVISTSVHGSNWDRGPIPNAVRAIQLVGPGGNQHWIEPDQWRITDEARLRARLSPEVQIHYDDDWFDSVVVSMGSMGVITSVVLEVTDQYSLEKTCEQTTWSDLKPRLDPTHPKTVFDPTHPYVMVALDPAEMGHETCYVTTHKLTTEAPTPAATAVDPLAAFCQLDQPKLIEFLKSNGVDGHIAGWAVSSTRDILNLIRSMPGGLSDFLGTVLNPLPEVTAGLVSSLTRDALKPGETQRNVAHKIMAPVNPGECAVRGHAIELAFDATKGGHLTFVDDARTLLDDERTKRRVLGGYISLRFVGPSRAILSPQQSTRTCMIEITGIRSLTSTDPLLDELEKLGKTHGAIQHWGMFTIPNLSEQDLTRAYPRLDTWRRVRQEITNGGTVNTFENAFSTRVGLDKPPAGVPLLWQNDWRFCSKCMGMAFAGGATPGACPAGGTHDHTGSGNYGFAHNTPSAPGQRDWRWCSKCMGMTFGGAPWTTCPAGGVHDLGHSGEYTIVRNGQADWRLCSKCQCLCSADGECPAGGKHALAKSADYWLGFSSPDTVGEPGWMACKRCRTLSQKGGRCFGGKPHSLDTSVSYSIPRNAPTAPGQPHWRLCKKCHSLSVGAGRCFAGGAKKAKHDLVGSGDYTVRENAGQAGWRRCQNCQGLWFSGGGGQGVCPVQPAMIAVPGGVRPGDLGPAPDRGAIAGRRAPPPQGHVPAPDEFFVPFQ